MQAATQVGQQPQPGGGHGESAGQHVSVFVDLPDGDRQPRQYTVSAVFAVKKVSPERGGFVEAFRPFWACLRRVHCDCAETPNRGLSVELWDCDRVAALRNAMGEKDFDSAWAEGAALSTDEAIAYAKRGRGERKRPTSGWGSLTPTEHDVVRPVNEGLSNKDITTRLFVSPRTVQTHLAHVYTKLRLTSRVQLVQEAARHA